ncbi:hypothetical protein QUF72_07390 [Desulfobacterales bacterium HSG2]|nr:hypothetical protein [Desulfobacterales bacterium HSG2]
MSRKEHEERETCGVSGEDREYLRPHSVTNGAETPLSERQEVR